MKDRDFNREGWLTELSSRIQDVFKGFNLAPYRLTCGWPCRNGLGRRTRTVGECHYAQPGKYNEIFISPLLSDSLEVAGTALHEMAHVAAGPGSRHGPKYVRVARHVGLTKGKPANAMPGDLLNDKLRRVIESLGPYPHKGMFPVVEKVEKKASAVTPLQCKACGCTVTISFKWLGASGAPTCGCGGEMFPV